MVDIAKLGIAVDTTDLKRGEADLKRFARTGAVVDDQIDEIARSSRVAGASVYGMGQNANAASRASGIAGGGFRNLSLQLNQVAQQGSITGNYLQALTFQLPDILLGFGTMGIVAGIAAGALAPLALNILDTTNRLKKMHTAMGEVREGVGEYISLIRRADLVSGEFEDALDDMGAAAKRATASLAEASLAETLRQSLDITKQITEQFQIQGRIASGPGIADQFDLVGLLKPFRSLSDEVQKTANDFGATLRVLQRDLSLEDRIIEMADLQRQYMILAEASGDVSEAEQQTLNLISNQIIELDRVRAATEAIKSTEIERANEVARISALTRQEAELKVRADGDAVLAARQLEQKMASVYGLYANTRAQAVSLAAATSEAANQFNRLSKQDKVYSGRGGDPRQSDDYQSRLGYKSVEEIVSELTPKTVGLAKALTKTAKPAKTLADTLKGHLKQGVDGISGAFERFVKGGLTDFRGFAKSILQEFTNLIGKMVAMAARNKLNLAFGLKSPAGQAGSFGQIGGAISKLGGGKGVLGGLGNAVSGGLGGIDEGTLKGGILLPGYN
ncbi:MAG: phage tail tape measure C-terminal domain-containing protein, partial [Litorivicinus sp.]